MPWKYIQVNGNLIHNGELVATGHSGFGAGKNNPAMQAAVNVGPVPVGRYEISRSFHSETHGPICMHLSPLAGTETHGRGGFLIHEDSGDRPGSSSHGCIVLPRPVRLRIADSEDRELEII